MESVEVVPSKKKYSRGKTFAILTVTHAMQIYLLGKNVFPFGVL